MKNKNTVHFVKDIVETDWLFDPCEKIQISQLSFPVFCLRVRNNILLYVIFWKNQFGIKFFASYIGCHARTPALLVWCMSL